MGCPRHKKSKPKDKFTRFDDVKGPIYVSKDIKSTEFNYDQLASGKLLDMAGMSRKLNQWCLEKDYANEIIGGISIAASGTASSHISAGNTYLGQLVTHDLLGETLDSYASNRRFPIEVDQSSRDSESTEVLHQFNLDTLYPSSFKHAFEHGYIDKYGVFQLEKIDGYPVDTPEERRQKRLDLSRPEDLKGWPILADRRNSENVILAQLVVFFLRLHNRAVEVCAQSKNDDPKENYERARSFVTLIYQYLIRDEFLPQILRNKPCLIENGLPQSFVSNFADMKEIPIEFSGAIFRMGHSMIMKTYTLKPCHKGAISFVDDLLSSNKKINYDFLIDWEMFFEHGEKAEGFNHAGSIDLAIVTAELARKKSQENGSLPCAAEHLFNMQNLVKLDVEACKGLPSGGQLMTIFGKLFSEQKYQDVPEIIGLGDFCKYKTSILAVMSEISFLKNVSLENLPLNIFILVEAYAINDGDEKRLGPVATLFILLVYQITLNETSLNIGLGKDKLRRELGEKLWGVINELKDNDKLCFKAVNNYLNK